MKRKIISIKTDKYLVFTEDLQKLTANPFIRKSITYATAISVFLGFIALASRAFNFRGYLVHNIHSSFNHHSSLGLPLFFATVVQSMINNKHNIQYKAEVTALSCLIFSTYNELSNFFLDGKPIDNIDLMYGLAGSLLAYLFALTYDKEF